MWSSDRMRGGAEVRGYDARWRKARKAFLLRHPLCAECFKAGRLTPATVVDLHVVGTGDALRSAVICFYLSNEGVSMLENAAHLGLPVPDKLKSVLEQLHGRTDEKESDENG